MFLPVLSTTDSKITVIYVGTRIFLVKPARSYLSPAKKKKSQISCFLGVSQKARTLQDDKKEDKALCLGLLAGGEPHTSLRSRTQEGLRRNSTCPYLAQCLELPTLHTWVCSHFKIQKCVSICRKSSTWKSCSREPFESSKAKWEMSFVFNLQIIIFIHFYSSWSKWTFK